MTECLKCGTSWDAPVSSCPQCNSIPPTTLRQLSDAATPGAWLGNPRRLFIDTENGKFEGPVMSYLIGNKGSAPGTVVSLASERHADHHFVAALVNAYRAGELVERGSETVAPITAEQLAEVRGQCEAGLTFIPECNCPASFALSAIWAELFADTDRATNRHGVLDG